MKLKITLLGAALTLLAGVALAGATQSVPVDVDLDARFAFGDMVTARTGKGKDVFIGCGTRVNADPMFTFGFCQARDVEGDLINCFTQNPVLLDAMAATSAYAFITFAWQDDGDGGAECTRVGFSTQSFYLPSNVEGNK